MGQMSGNNNSQKQKLQRLRQANVLEALKDLGGDTKKSFTNDLVKETGSEFMRQLLGLTPKKKFSGEIQKGESLVVNDVFSGKKRNRKRSKSKLDLREEY
jgi:hypothetical protein